MEAQQTQAPRTATVRFTGNAGEYFKIWIVNIALTVVTLGIYSLRRSRDPHGRACTAG
ncbi:MAG: DUF898 family protein [Woeseiaceae bacterium]|nr:DUF898 family protein [Woeseiaceae bacterium]